jgi:hypothetical protein
MEISVNKTYVLYEGEKSYPGYSNFKVKFELRLVGKQHVERNALGFNAYLYAIITPPKGDNVIGAKGKVEVVHNSYGYCKLYYRDSYIDGYNRYNTGSIGAGVETEILVREIDNEYFIFHDLDGSISQFTFKHDISGIYYSCVEDDFDFVLPESLREFTFSIPKIDRAVYPTTANNFTDMENPAFNYTPPTGGKSYTCVPSSVTGNPIWLDIDDQVSSLQAAISFDGSTPDIAYRNIPIDGTYYAFSLTEAERDGNCRSRLRSRLRYGRYRSGNRQYYR